MKRRLTVVFLIIVISLMNTSTAFATKINVNIDGIQQKFDVEPLIQQGTTLVPMRAIFERFGADLSWDAQTNAVTAIKENKIIKLTIGQKQAFINDKKIDLNVPAQIIKSKTMVPLRFISETLGAIVKWDSKSSTVNIYSARFTKFIDSIVVIKTYDGKGNVLRTGSGFVVRQDGLIATCDTVTYGCYSASVQFRDGKSYNVQYVANSERDRIAVLKIDCSGLPVLSFGDSTKVSPKERVLIIGAPQADQFTASDGEVISLTTQLYPFGNDPLIHITAPCSRPLDGAPLFNMKGEVVGISHLGDYALPHQDQHWINEAIPINEKIFNEDQVMTIPEYNKVWLETTVE